MTTRSAFNFKAREPILSSTQRDREAPDLAATIRVCHAGLDKVKIGMTDRETIQLACKPESINSTVTPPMAPASSGFMWTAATSILRIASWSRSSGIANDCLEGRDPAGRPQSAVQPAQLPL